MPSILLDTHVLLWATGDPRLLGHSATSTITDPSTDVYVSAASVFEIAIKRSIGKLSLEVPTAALLDSIEAIPLPITVAHAEATERLPMLHRDPFDRLLAAQAMNDQLTLLTADERLLAYPIESLDART